MATPLLRTQPGRPSDNAKKNPATLSNAARYAAINHTHKEIDVKDLNKYNKSQTYTKSEIDSKLAKIKEGIRYQIATSNLTVDDHTGYVANHTTPITAVSLQLPSSASAGFQFEVTTGENAGGWSVVPSVGQQIFLDGSGTSISYPYFKSVDDGDSAKVVCVISNERWNVVSKIGSPALLP